MKRFIIKNNKIYQVKSQDAFKPIPNNAILVWKGGSKVISYDELLKLPRTKFTKVYTDDEIKHLNVYPRKELWGQPVLKGFLGPMWDGNRLRYETQAVYDILST